MSLTENKTSHSQKLEDLESVISKAIKKVRGNKENDLCKYIPVDSGGYMHHFTLRKMKHKSPSSLLSLIEKFIMIKDRPLVVAPKQRAPRGSRKRREHLPFSKFQLDRLLSMARVSGDHEMVSLLSPKKSLAHNKRDLIQSIRHEIVDEELWNAYVESINLHQSMLAAVNGEES